jgi:hypothetical protein
MYGSLDSVPLEGITFNWLFERVNQEDVFLRYLGFYELGKKFKNPLREDKRADCSFYWSEGILFFKDWNWKVFTCISVVMEVDKLEYHQALTKIYNEYVLNNKSTISITKQEIKKKEKHKKKIDVKIQPFTKEDISYLKQFGITSKLCKLYKIFSIECYWIDNKLVYTYSKGDKCIGYYFGNGTWKLYHYDRDDYRFVGNTSGKDLQGLDQLDWIGDLLIITKSMKDVIVYRAFGFNAVAPHSETNGDWCSHIEGLKKRFKRVLINFDNDKTGLKVSKEISEKYNIPSFFIDEEKDISDYKKHFKKEKTKQLIINKTNEENNSF